MGYPPSGATDAQPGVPAMAYQSADIIFGQREGNSRILVRIDGARARAGARSGR